MFQSNTPFCNKQVIFKKKTANSSSTSALGLGVDMAGVNTIIHYGAPHSLIHYFQESDHAGRYHHWYTGSLYNVLRKEIPKQHMNESKCSENISRRSHHVSSRAILKDLDPNLDVPNQEASLL